MTTSLDWQKTVSRLIGNMAEVNNISESGGLSPDFIQKSITAFGPAMALNMQRMMTDPQTLSKMTSEDIMAKFTSYAGDPSAAFTQQGRKDGAQLFATFFGSDAAARSVSESVARLMGVEIDPVRQVQAALTSMIAGQFAKSVSNTLGTDLEKSGNLDHITEKLVELGKVKMPGQDTASNPLADMMTNFMTGFLDKKADVEQESDPDQIPLTDILGVGEAMQEAYFKELNALFNPGSRPGRSDDKN